MYESRPVRDQAAADGQCRRAARGVPPLKEQVLVATSVLALATQVQSGVAQDEVLILLAKQTLVSTLAPAYPSIPLQQWLGEVADVDTTAISWEVNDCGEGGDGRQAPTCVEAMVPVLPDTTVHISLFARSSTGASSEPAIWMLYSAESGQYQILSTLDDVVEYVRRLRQ